MNNPRHFNNKAPFILLGEPVVTQVGDTLNVFQNVQLRHPLKVMSFKIKLDGPDDEDKEENIRDVLEEIIKEAEEEDVQNS